MNVVLSKEKVSVPFELSVEPLSRPAGSVDAVPFLSNSTIITPPIASGGVASNTVICLVILPDSLPLRSIAL